MEIKIFKRYTKVYVFFILAVTLYSSILGPYLKSVGLTNIEVGLIYSVFPFISILLSPIVGRISDKTSRNRIIRSAIVLEIVAVMCYLFGNSSIFFVWGRLLDSIAISIISILALAKIEDNIDNKNRGKYTGIALSIQYVAKLIGPVIAGFSIDYWFKQAPFVLSLGILIALFFAVEKEKYKKQKLNKKDFSWIDEIVSFLKIKQMRGIAEFGVAWHATLPLTTLFIPIFIIETLGLGYIHVGYALFAFNFSHIFQFVFGQYCNEKPECMIVDSTFVYGMIFCLLFFVNSYFGLIVILIVAGFANSAWNVSAWTFMSQFGEKKKMEGEILGTYTAIAKKGAFLFFIIGGFVVEYFSINILMLINGVLLIFMAVKNRNQLEWK